MNDKINHAKENSGSARALLEPIFDQLDGFVEPLKSVIDGIKDAASTVGISFG
jgi:hypothetical protein